MARGRSPSLIARMVVWGRAGGRCQFAGCGKRLDGDLVTGDLNKNQSYLAHIIASDPGGKRGDPVLSHQLSDAPENLMLMCDPHHREIDDPQKIQRYTVEALREMKRRHEDRLDRLMSNPSATAAHILRISATVGDNETAVPLKACIDALTPMFTLADRAPIDIKIRGMDHKDSDPTYYPTEIGNLRARFDREIRGRYQEGDLEHLAIFGFAPIPILIELGRLLSDLSEATVYGRHREPNPGWTWPNDGEGLNFGRVVGPAGSKTVALKLSVTAEITDDRVRAAFPGQDVSIWEIRSSRIGANELRNQADLAGYRILVGKIFDEIRAQHGPDVELSVFPAVPTTCAIEFGRVWQPKAHLSFNVYDQTQAEGFVLRHRIGTARKVSVTS
jgi:hypothetical protein